MVLCRQYDQENKLDKVWYKSSNILYSECDDHVNALKTLRVTFSNGRTYQYTNVDVNDYLMFMHGGLDGSNGKALNRYIKPKYDCERIPDKDVNEIEYEKQQALASMSNNGGQENVGNSGEGK